MTTLLGRYRCKPEYLPCPTEQAAKNYTMIKAQAAQPTACTSLPSSPARVAGAQASMATRPTSRGVPGFGCRFRNCPGSRSLRRVSTVATASAQYGGASSSDPGSGPSTSYSSNAGQPPYTLEDTRSLVETAMLAAVSGLAYLLSTILKLENSLGYFLPLPVVLAALRSGAGAGWKTMMATCFLLVVLLGPLRALSYFFLHGVLAATLGSLWSARTGFWLSVVLGALVRMAGQLSYLVMSSVTMNENMFALLLSNVYNTLDQVSATLGVTGAPSPMAVNCTIGSLLLMNGLTYCFLVHVVYRVVLGTMGYQLGPLPGIVSKYLNAGKVEQPLGGPVGQK